jgi:tetratricopeptide (TPR) repeat protein
MQVVLCLLAAAALFLMSARLLAQDCDVELREAEAKYRSGFFDEAIDLLDRCLNKGGINKEQRMQAYRLKGLAYLAKDYLNQAKESIKNLMELVPDYEPNPEQDPPAFRQMVTEVKEEQTQDEPPQQQPAPTATSEPPQRETWPQQKKSGPLFSAYGGIGLTLYNSPEEIKDFFGNGFNLSLGGDVGFRMSPSAIFGIGGAAELHGFSGEDEEFGVQFNLFYYELYLSGRLTLQPADGAVGFYLLGGVGLGIVQFTDVDFEETTTESGLMVPLRAGLKFKVHQVISIFAETGVSIHFAQIDFLLEENSRYFPIRIGLSVGSILD